MNLPSSIEGPHRLLRAWQLAVLRFAVTLDDCDRDNVAALAAELDRLSGRARTDSLHFFRRTSSRLCAAIDGQQKAALDRFCRQIDEPRLRLAFAAAVGIAAANPAPAEARPKRNPDLFKGLRARPTASL